MPLYDNVLNLVNGELTNQHLMATTNQVNADAALRLAQGQQLQQNMQAMADARTAMQRAAELEAYNANAPTAPATSAPDANATPTVGASSTGTNSGIADPYADLVKQQQAVLASARRNRIIMERAGAVDQAQKFADNEREAMANLNALVEKQWTAGQKLAEQKANIAATIVDQPTLNAAANSTGDAFGPDAKARFIQRYTDPSSGLLMATPTVLQQAQADSKQFTDAAKQADAVIAQRRLDAETARDAQTKANQNRERDQEDTHLRQQADATNQMIADRQERMQIAQDNHGDLQVQRAIQPVTKLAEHYDQETKNFDTQKVSMDAASKIMINPDGTLKTGNITNGFRPLDPTDSKALATAYVKMIYPSYSSGQSKALHDVNELAGVPARTLNYIEGIFAGHGTLPGDVASEMFKTMTNQFKSLDDNQAKIEKSYLTKLASIPGVEKLGDTSIWIRPKSVQGTQTVTDTTPTSMNAGQGPTRIAQDLNKAGVGFTVKAGVVNLPDAATANKGIALLPIGATYVGPDGVTYRKTK